MSEMIDRLVKAIRDPWDHTLHSEAACRDIVRDVLKNLREPTDAMLKAADVTMKHRTLSGPGRFSTLTDGYQAMIDEALK